MSQTQPRPLHHNTPLLYSHALSRAAGTHVWLKMDALQPTGSFKLRGIGHACQTYAANGATRFVSSSGGNAGIAAAYAGQQLDVPVTVYVPETTTPGAIEQIEMHQAEVTIVGRSWQEANEVALASCSPSDAFIHPFDDPLLWQGHASLVSEIATLGLTPGAIVTAVGGGGLLSGIALGMAQCNWGKTAIVTAETQGAASFNAAMAANELVQLPSIDSVATSLGARQVCQQALETSRVFTTLPQVVSDAEAVAACHRFLTDHRVLVEPACGAALAVAYADARVLADYEAVVIEVCGGSTMDLETLQTLPGW